MDENQINTLIDFKLYEIRKELEELKKKVKESNPDS